MSNISRVPDIASTLDSIIITKRKMIGEIEKDGEIWEV